MRFTEKIVSWGKLSPLYDLFGKRSYAQSGEDLVVDALLGRQRKGFYVDVGAYHPKVFSNTYLFYKRGWRGICVEPNPEAKWGFGVARHRDVFVNVGVALLNSDSDNHSKTCHSELDSESRKSALDAPARISGINSSVRHDIGCRKCLEYFVFGEGAVNTFSAEQARENKKVGRKLLKVIKVPVRSLESILSEYLPKGQKIDILSVDVEGMDLEVLKSNNWKKFRPRIVVVEDLNTCHSELDSESRKSALDAPARISGINSSVRHDKVGIDGFLGKLGYELVGKTGYSLIFRDRKSRP